MARLGRITAFAAAFWALAGAAMAFDNMTFDVTAGDKALKSALEAASLTWAKHKDKGTNPQDLLGAANADYRVLVEALYAAGYYGGTVSIRIDGTEAASVDAFAVPKTIKLVAIRIDPGPLFHFGRIRVAPEPPGFKPEPAFAPGQPALSGVIASQVQAVIDGWRAAGRPKAKVVKQTVVADHKNHLLAVDVSVDPGRKAVFGDLLVTGDSKVRASKIKQIAGLRSGEPFSPTALDTVAQRLRRVPAFSSVVLSEARTIKPDGSIDIIARITDRAKHRIGVGAELASSQGLTLTGYWLDRNLFGGGEQFRIDASVSNIGGQTGGTDYSFGLRLDNPSPRRVDTTVYYSLKYENLDEPNYTSESTTIGTGFTRIFNAQSKGQVGIELSQSTATDDIGTRSFTILSLPASITLDRRKDQLDPKNGIYLKVSETPFHDFAQTVSGLQTKVDLRGYKTLGTGHPFTLAGRAQLGSLVGAGINQVQPDMLFFSGGGGTVRGQPYQSLGVDLGGGVVTGGRSFLGFSAEVRTRVVGDFGAAVFADTGYIGAEAFPNGSGEWQTGAGLGMRYFTSFGPFRVDLAWPVGGKTRGSVQLYIGIGQAF